MIKRRKTRQVKVGGVKVGGAAPISIQSMTTTVTADSSATISQIKKLQSYGCEIVRVAVRDINDARAVKAIRKKINIPLVCDIHFDYRLALECIKQGADKIRLNPGNIRKIEEIADVVRSARRARIPIRVGVNSGSAGGSSPDALVGAAKKYLKILEGLDFHDIILSLKGSDVVSTVESYRKISGICDYPLHLGVTAAGPGEIGTVKSSIGIGSLLVGGIGDTVRVSLTAAPEEEVLAAKRILSALNLKSFGPEIVSCPTCGRCRVDLIKIVKKAQAAMVSNGCQMRSGRYPKVAIMGCEVNGPGEAKEADIGIAAGMGSGALFIKGKIIKRVKEDSFITELMKEMKKL